MGQPRGSKRIALFDLPVQWKGWKGCDGSCTAPSRQGCQPPKTRRRLNLLVTHSRARKEVFFQVLRLAVVNVLQLHPHPLVMASSCALGFSTSSTPALMATRRHKSWLGGSLCQCGRSDRSHLVATSMRSMEDLRALWATCRFMHRVCRNTHVG